MLNRPQTTKELNRNNNNRKSDQFYVRYLGLPENVSNLFGRQTKSMGRPSITLETTNINHRSNRYTDMQQVRFEPIEVVMFEDENGLTSQAIHIQLFRQINRGKDIFGWWDEEDDGNFRFDIGIDLYNSNEEITESYVLKNCFISNVDFDQVNITDEDTEPEIRLTVEFNNIDYTIVNEYVEERDSYTYSITHSML